ncbi:ABC transporter substrate-binding protein [Streptomyces sp. A1499]|uniref:ABC transporter substrate-binding protein n=1 Tax=Streptomyces sp. A1499 TaxID=2563104 RepID=UPI00109E8DD7|nr:ABC transporter substrate-binding protein [Streptomyces sp. A1499]THC50149.1 peptide-binding protein [Streptomyces sp. A1499]
MSLSLVAGCGALSSEGSDGEQVITVGTMSAPSTLDPAQAWDSSWELYRNVFQTLLSLPSGATEPEPDAAESCAFDGASNTVYVCELREGLKFSDGHELDAAAVKHSFDRMRTLEAKGVVKGGPMGLLGSLDKVETKGERTVVFRLRKPDATFPLVLSTPAMSIVDPREYPADKLRTGNGLTGSGPYALKAYEPREKAELVKNDHYKGAADVKNDGVTIRYFKKSSAMVDALEKQEIDVTFRGLDAGDVIDAQSKSGDGADEQKIALVEGAGTEIRYLVFNTRDPWAGKLPVRRAFAQLVDRPAIAHKVYKDTVDPLYSMVPRGLTGHATGFFDDYGDPSVTKARKILADAGIDGPVPLTLWHTTDRYGSATALEFAELKRQLEASGLFEITLKGRPWNEFQEGYSKGEYPVFGRGWFPDFPDADNFIAPFVGAKNVLNTPYPSKEITEEILPRERRETDRGAVVDDFERAQQILVDDVRLLPLWQGKQYIVASEEIAGGERALDPSAIMMMWELQRKTSW